MGKARDLFKKIGDIKGTFHATMGMINDRNVKAGMTVENSKRDGNTRPPDLPLEKPICRSGSNS